MRAGSRLDSDAFIKEFDEAKQLAQEILQLIQVRASLACLWSKQGSSAHGDAGGLQASRSSPCVSWVQDRNVTNAGGGPEASRKTATARRKLGTLGTLIEKLLKTVDAPEAQLCVHGSARCNASL